MPARRQRHNAGFQRKRALVFAQRPTSRSISDARLLAFCNADPRRQQLNEPACPRAVALTKAVRLGEDNRFPLVCPSASPAQRSNTLKKSCTTRLPSLQSKGAQKGQRGVDIRTVAPKDRKITAQAWAVAGSTANLASSARVPWRIGADRVALPPLAGHFPGVVTLMATHKWRMPAEDVQPLPPGSAEAEAPVPKPIAPRQRRCVRQVTRMFSSEADVVPIPPTKPSSPVKVVRSPRHNFHVYATKEEHACRAPPHDWFDMSYREPLEKMGYLRRKLGPQIVRLQPVDESANAPEEVFAETSDHPLQDDPWSLAYIHSKHKPDSSILATQFAFGMVESPPWWAQHIKIETADSATFSWLYWARVAGELGAKLDKEVDVGCSQRGLTRLYLDWMFCRQALPSGPRSRGETPRSGSGSGLRKPRCRRPRSNPLRVASRGGSRGRRPSGSCRPIAERPRCSAPAGLACEDMEMVPRDVETPSGVWKQGDDLKLAGGP